MDLFAGLRKQQSLCGQLVADGADEAVSGPAGGTGATARPPGRFWHVRAHVRGPCRGPCRARPHGLCTWCQARGLRCSWPAGWAGEAVAVVRPPAAGLRAQLRGAHHEVLAAGVVPLHGLPAGVRHVAALRLLPTTVRPPCPAPGLGRWSEAPRVKLVPGYAGLAPQQGGAGRPRPAPVAAAWATPVPPSGSTATSTATSPPSGLGENMDLPPTSRNWWMVKALACCPSLGLSLCLGDP